MQEPNKAIDRGGSMRGGGFLVEAQHFSLDFLEIPCDTNTMNFVLNTLTALTSHNFSVRLQEAPGLSHATELAYAGVVGNLKQ